MENKHTVLVFDLDGTLIDSTPKLTGEVIRAFAKLGKDISEKQIIPNKRWYELAAQYGIPKEDFKREFDKRKSWEDSLRDGEVPLFSDALPCLETLLNRGVTLAALTRSAPEYTKAKMDFHRLEKYFEDRVAITPITAKSKRIEAIGLMERIGCESIKCAYFIGDRTEDIVLAKEISNLYDFIKTNGIYINREELPIPEEVRTYPAVKSLAEIHAIIGE